MPVAESRRAIGRRFATRSFVQSNAKAWTTTGRHWKAEGEADSVAVSFAQVPPQAQEAPTRLAGQRDQPRPSPFLLPP